MPIQTFNTFPRPIPDSGGGSNVKRIQRGENTLTLTTTDIAISAVDLTKSVVMVSLFSPSTSPANSLVGAEITSPTNLRLNLNTAGASPKVSWQVIEYNNVKSKQSGTTAIPSTNTNQSISAVNLSKSILIVSFRSTSTATSGHNNNAELTTSTNINFEINDATPTGYWQVIESSGSEVTSSDGELDRCRQNSSG